MAEKINDHQLDHANAEIQRLRDVVMKLRTLCVRRLDLLQRVVNCQIGLSASGKIDVRLTPELRRDIERETDENEVNP